MSTQTPSVEERLNHLKSHHADRVAAFRQRLAQIGYGRVLVVLLDIGKNVHWFTVSTAASQELIRPQRLPTTLVGLTRFFQAVDPLIPRGDYDLVLLGHEPTGVYHEPWARAFIKHYAAYLEGQVKPKCVDAFIHLNTHHCFSDSYDAA